MTKRARTASAIAYLLIDVVVVLLFIYAGRETRGSGFGEELAAAGPFFAGIALGWLAGRVWRTPRAILWSGLIVWLSTVVVGLFLRSLLGEQTDSRFAFVSFITLGAFLLGWRGIAWILDALFGRALPKVVDEKYRR